MPRLLTLAINTFQEARHNKVLYVAVGFAVAVILFSIFLGEVSLHQEAKVVKDVGMATISIFGVFVAIYLSVNNLFKELQLRTIYSIISKPIRRYEVVLGKFIGMALVLFVVVGLMTAFLLVVTLSMDFQLDLSILPAIFLIYAELLIVCAFGILFSSFSTPFLSGFFTFGIFIVGRVSYELNQFGERSKNLLFKNFAKGIQKVYDLEAFNIRAEVVHNVKIYAQDVWPPVAYALLLVSILLLISIIIFQRRDFK